MILEAFLRSNLALAGIPVYLEKPESPPDRYVILERTGTAQADLIDRYTIAAQTYGPSLYEAAMIAGAVREAMQGMEEYPEIGSVSLADIYNFTDPTTKEYRYQAIFEVVYYEE